MAKFVRGRPTPRPEQEGRKESESDATKGDIIADYNLDIVYEGSYPKVNQNV